MNTIQNNIPQELAIILEYISAMRTDWIRHLASNSSFQFFTKQSEDLTISNVNITNDSWNFDIDYPFHVDVQDKGIIGTEQNQAGNSPYRYKDKKPPLNEIRDWLSYNGIQASPYAIQTSLFKKGIEPRDLKIDDFINGWVSQIAEEKALLDADKITQPIENWKYKGNKIQIK